MISIGVVLQWWALYLMWEVAAKFAFSTKQIKLAWSDPHVALTFAIFLHFVAGILDGTYWQWAWSAKGHGNFLEPYLFKYGILPNIPFRHILPIIVAFLHLRAITLKNKEDMSKYYYRSAFVLCIGLLQVSYF